MPSATERGPSAPRPSVDRAGASALWWHSAVDGHVEWLLSDLARVIGLDTPAADAWRELVHPDDRHELAQFGQNLPDTVLVFRAVRPDGEVRRIRWRALGPHEHRGETGWSGLAEDITEQQRTGFADPAAAQYGRTLSTLLSARPSTFAGVVTQCLAELGALLGADRCATVRTRGSHPQNTLRWSADGREPPPGPPVPLAGSRSWLFDQLTSGSVVSCSTDDLPAEAADDREALRGQGVKAFVRLPISVDGSLVGFVAVDSVSDPRPWGRPEVAALEHFVDMLVAAGRRLRAIRRAEAADALTVGFARFSDAAMVMYDPQLQGVLRSNQAFDTLFGIEAADSAAEKLQKVVGSFATTDRRSWASIRESIVTSPLPAEPLDIRVRAADGSIRWLRRTLFPISDRHGSLIAIGGTATDVTAMYALVEELTRARDEAATADAAKTRFLARAGHELRTPLNAVLGFAALLTSAADEEQRSEYLAHVSAAAAHLLEITDDLLSTLRPAEAPAEHAARDLGEIVSRCVGIVSPLAQANGVRVEVDNRVERPVRRADLVRQIFVNLLSNAVKYSHRDGVVAVQFSEDETQLVIEVADAGIGIPSDEQQRIFDPFERLGAGRTGQPGTGLGLTIVKQAVDTLEGTIHVQSRPGAGTTVTVTIPVLTQLRPILVVEDDDASRLLFEIFLRRAPNPVHLVADARSALEAIEQLGPVAAAVVDWNLSDATGADLIPRLRAHPSTADARIIVVTAATTDDIRRRAERCGSDGFLEKPVRSDTLLAALGVDVGPAA